MTLELALVIFNTLLMPLVGAVSYLLWNKISGIEKEQEAMADRIWAELKTVKHEVDGMRLNYLDRFTDIKDLITNNHLHITEKISILETLLKQNLK